MKFRALMTDGIAMKEFMNIIISISKLSKECVMRIVPDRLYFIISEEDNGPRQPLVWCDMSNKYYFKEFNMSGISPEHNEIYLDVSPVMLAKSLVSLRQNAKCLKLKLTNKQSPCLTLEIEMGTDGQQSRQCVHDIPVEIISRKQWSSYAEPQFTDFHVTLQMPALKAVKNIVERMKGMSQYLIVSADKTGRMTLKIETTLINLSAHFPNLSIHSFADGIRHNDDDSDSVSACIDIRKFVMFLMGLQISNCSITCSIVDESMVKLHLTQPEAVKIQCFLTQVSR